MKIGDIVAFNYSGEARVGKIVDIGKTMMRNRVNVKVKHMGSDQISHVRNPTSVLVLTPEIFNQ